MKRLSVSVFSGLLVSIVLIYMSVAVSTSAALNSVDKLIKPIITSKFNEDLFSNEYGRLNRSQEILGYSLNINELLKDWIKLSNIPIKNTVAQITVIDGDNITQKRINSEPLNSLNHSFEIDRNGITRKIEYSLYYEIDYKIISIFFILIMMIFFLSYNLLPTPLRSKQNYWYRKMLSVGMDLNHALKLSRQHKFNKDLNKNQEIVFNALKEEGVDFEEAFEVASSKDVENFDSRSLSWFKSIFQKTKNTSEAIKIALSPDKLVIDPVKRELIVHGLTISMKLAPLSYYAWYAMKRKNSDGWVKNPNSMRRNLEYSDELKELFGNWGVHGTACSAIEKGVAADTLTKNRSNIRKTLKNNICDEVLVDFYCFEDRNSENGGVKEFRLAMSPDKIEVYT